MPRKKRQIRNDYRAAGFTERQGKGDHTVFSYPGLPKHYAVDGADRADAKPYGGICGQRYKRRLKCKGRISA